MAINNKIRVTNFTGLSNGTFSTRQNLSVPSGSEYFKPAMGGFIGGGVFLQILQDSSGSYGNPVSHILRSTDFITFTSVSTPTISMFVSDTENLRQIAYGNGIFIILDSATTSIISTNYGASWSRLNTFTPNSVYSNIAYSTGNTFMITINGGTTLLTTNANNGASTSFSAVGNHGLTGPYLVYGNGRWLVLSASPGGGTGTVLKYSDNNGTTWSSSVNTGTKALSAIKFINNKFIGINNSGYIYISDNGTRWALISIVNPAILGMDTTSITKVDQNYFMLSNNTIFYTKDFYKWRSVSNLTGDTNVVNATTDKLNSYFIPEGDATGINKLPVYLNAGSSGLYYSRGTMDLNDGESSYIDVTATKGQLIRTIRVPVIKGQYTNDIYSAQVYPNTIILSATLDGVVNPSQYAAAIAGIVVYTNGIDSTSDWTIVKTDPTGVTSSLSGSNVTITSMATNTDSANISLSFINNTTGIIVNSNISVIKNKTGTTSGISIGSSYTGFSTTQTAIYIKFLTNGYFQIKQGSGGTYTNAGIWYNPPNTVTPQGGNYYMIMDYTSTTGNTLTAGTNGIIGGSTWNQMNVDREYYLSDATSGTHSIDLLPKLATSNTGANAVSGKGILELRVP